MDAEAKFKINYSITQNVNGYFDNQEPVIETLAYICYKNIIMYYKYILNLPPASRKCQLYTGEKAGSLGFGENS